MKHYLLIIAVSLLPIVSIFVTPDLPHTHDGPVHLARMAAYYKALADGQILPRWAGDLNYGYGMPLFNFIYHTPYLVASAFLLLKVNLVTTFKIVLAFSYILSGIFMFAFARAFWNDNKKALLVAIFYQFVPFRLIELWVRGSFGEVYAYAFLPLVLYGLTMLFRSPSQRWFTLIAGATALLIISHNSMSLMFFATCMLFVLVFGKTNRLKWWGVCALASGLALSAFYWLPAMAEHRYTYGDLFMKNMYRSHFPPLLTFFIPNLTNRPELQTGGISVQWGIVHTLAIILSIPLFIRKRFSWKEKLPFLFSLALIASSLIFMQPISIIFWKNISLLRQFQFPWRLLGLVGFATSFISLSFIMYPLFKKPFVFGLLIAAAVLSTAYYWRPPLGFDRVTDESQYWNYPLNTTYFGETDVIWSGGPATKYPKERIQVVDGNAIVSHFVKRSTVQMFTVSAVTNTTLVSHTEYFPGWRVFVDGVKVPIQFQNPDHRGLIMFQVPSGVHTVTVSLGKTKIQLFSELLSLSTLIIFVVLPFKRTYEKSS